MNLYKINCQLRARVSFSNASARKSLYNFALEKGEYLDNHVMRVSKGVYGRKWAFQSPQTRQMPDLSILHPSLISIELKNPKKTVLFTPFPIEERMARKHVTSDVWSDVTT